MTELLVGTKKGLFTLRSDRDGAFRVTSRSFPGQPVEYAMRDRRSGRYFASVTSPFYGPKLWTATDPADEWRQIAGIELPDDAGALARLWTIVPGERDGLLYLGGDPGVLFESDDAGDSWRLNDAFWSQPTRAEWQPGGGGLCLHTIATWPEDPSRVALGISAVGVWLTDDGGQTWTHGNAGLVPRYLPEEARAGALALCVHDIQRSPARPDRLFLQFHGGVYRSDDAGSSWTEIGADLPADFGFPIEIDPEDPNSAFVIPLTADMDRVTHDGVVRVFETRDGGATWEPRGRGLPDRDAYLTVLRQAFTREGSGRDLGLFFGATSGDVFASTDAGRRWSVAAANLPPVFSVRAA